MRKFSEVIKSIDWAQITPATYVRYILMIVTVINALAARFGWTPISVDESELYQVVSDIITVVTVIINTWFNNSVTKEPIEADKARKENMNASKNQDTTDAVG